MPGTEVLAGRDATQGKAAKAAGERPQRHRNLFWKPTNDGTRVWHTPMWGGRVYGEPVKGDLVAAACMAAYGPHGAKLDHRMQRVMRVARLISASMRRLDASNPHSLAGAQSLLYHSKWDPEKQRRVWGARPCYDPTEKRPRPTFANPGSTAEIARRLKCAPGGVKLWYPRDEANADREHDTRIYFQCGNMHCPFCYQRRVQECLTKLREMADRNDPWWAVRWQVSARLLLPDLAERYKAMGWTDAHGFPDSEHCLKAFDERLRRLAKSSANAFKRAGCTGAVVVRPRVMLTKLFPVFELTYIGTGDRPASLLKFPGRNSGRDESMYSSHRRLVNQAMEVHEWAGKDAPWQIARTAFSRPSEYFIPKRHHQYWWIRSLNRKFKSIRLVRP